MPPRNDPRRPQTLKQAKKAYQKAGAAPRLSAIELRRLDRLVELDERAGRIQAKEKRKKANQKKKTEKMEKEKLARKKAGLSERKEAYIGPSQQRLPFAGVGNKGDSCDDDSSNEREDMAVNKEPAACGRARLLSRSSLRSPRQSHARGVGQLNARLSQSLHPTLLPSAPTNPFRLISPNMNSVKPPSTVIESKGSHLEDDGWMDFMENGSQIERELLSSLNKLRPKIYAAPPSSNSPLALQADGISNLFPLLSRQNTEGCGGQLPQTLPVKIEVSDPEDSLMDDEIDWPSTQGFHSYKFNSSRFPAVAVKQSKVNYDRADGQLIIPTMENSCGTDDKILDDDFLSLTKGVEVDSAIDHTTSVKDKKVDKTQRNVETESCFDEDAPSTQELLALAKNSDFDEYEEFEIGTQALLELVP